MERLRKEPTKTVRASRLDGMNSLSEAMSSRESSANSPPAKAPSAARLMSPRLQKLLGASGKRLSKTGAAPVSTSSAAQAAANFGLQRREEQLRKSAISEISQTERLFYLDGNVKQLQKDMREVLSLLKGGNGAADADDGADGGAAASAGPVRLAASEITVVAPMSATPTEGRVRFAVGSVSATSVDPASLHVRVPE